MQVSETDIAKYRKENCELKVRVNNVQEKLDSLQVEEKTVREELNDYKEKFFEALMERDKYKKQVDDLKKSSANCNSSTKEGTFI